MSRQQQQQRGGVLRRPPPGGSLDDEFVDFHSATVYYADLRSVPSPNWWNDSLISFALEYLQHKRFGGRNVGPAVRFVNAATTQLLQHETEVLELQDALDGAGLLARLKGKAKVGRLDPAVDLILFPVCDVGAVHQVGGSHWTLLVFNRRAGRFYTLDSLCDEKNRGVPESCRKLAENLSCFLLPEEYGLPDAQIARNELRKSLDGTRLTACLGPKQTNEHDCGPYVVAQAERVAEMYFKDRDSVGDMSSDEFTEQLRASLSAREVEGWRQKINDYLLQIKLEEGGDEADGEARAEE